ncbi:uncharacterized protein EDB93DRAFT_1110498 [Suillus bovinus]|uniref:uncharacterized protein n=1 Tax=Suillus bovinus TaxID=48563 RepID=UPI001B87ECB5|nr:uncharacterized protein EDB93DRAFT_1110498 [Suillus bovinus]KAG2124645.1 hypothetical protein EDB93DRAFT_1110498 [Suillus bovinus]
MVQGSTTCVISSAAAEKTHFKSPFPDDTPIEDLDFHNNSTPLALLLQLQISVLDIGCGKLIVKGRVKIKQHQEISHFEKDGIMFKDSSKLSADAIVNDYHKKSSWQ